MDIETILGIGRQTLEITLALAGPVLLAGLVAGVGVSLFQALTHIKRVLVDNGASLADVVKCTVFLADIGEWATFNEVYQEFFKQPYPARSALGTNGLALGARVEVECIAYRPPAVP